MFEANLSSFHERLIDETIKPECFFSIVIPIRNEAAHLPQTLKSLTHQIDSNNRAISPSVYEILFLVNNSTDESAQIIRHWRKRNPTIAAYLAEKTLPLSCSNVGYVRRCLMNEAYLRLKKNKFQGGIIATTDGDTEIAPDWILKTIAEIKKGADAVGGRIFLKSTELKQLPPQTRALHLRDTGYRLMAAEIEHLLDDLVHDSFPRHHQHFNGSFAVTTEAYAKAGGVPKVRFLEDVAFYNSLLRLDAKFRHSPFVRVQTSARAEGRTARGLSTQINEWKVMGEDGSLYLVESARSLNRRLSSRRKLRILWKKTHANEILIKTNEIERLAEDFLIPASFLQNELHISQTFGNLYEQIAVKQNQIGEWQKENPPVAINNAMHELRLMLEKFRCAGKTRF